MSQSLSGLPFTTLVPSADLRALRVRLQEEHQFRVEQLAVLREELSANPRLATDEVAVALRIGANHALCEIEGALGRMDAGQYGSCTRCTERLSPDRLDALPMAALCTRCQLKVSR